MRISGLKYFVKEASRNVFSSSWMSLASVFTVVASLLVFGMFMILTVNLNYIATQLEGDYEIILVVDDTYDKTQLEALGDEIKAVPNICNVVLDSKESRLQALKEDFDENVAILDGYEENNPLRDWYKVTLVDLQQSTQTVDELGKITGVVKIIRNEDTIKKLVTMTDYLGHISIWVMIALAVISVFIISNSIKLTVFARRREINIMKFVGATDWFIRWPFIIEGVIIGFIGSIFAFVIVAYGYESILHLLQSMDIEFIKFLPLSNLLLPLTGAFAGLGIILGGIGSLVSVRKHLKV